MADYIAGVAAMVTGLYVVIMGALYAWDQWHPLPMKSTEENMNFAGRSILVARFPQADKALLIFRAVGVLYWIGLGWAGSWIARAIEKGKSPQYYMFTHWNMLLLTAYFVVATICCIQVQNPDALPASWTRVHCERVARVATTLFSVCAAAALFITCSAYNPQSSLWGTTAHLTNILWVLLELAQNRLDLRLQHLRWFISWCFAYMCFTWVLVKAAEARDWPYPFMQTEAGSATKVYGAYFAVMMFQLLSFVVMRQVCVARKQLYSYIRWLPPADCADIIEVGGVASPSGLAEPSESEASL